MLGRKMCREACPPETNRCLDSTVHPHAGGTAKGAQRRRDWAISGQAAGEADKVMSKRTNGKTIERGQPRLLRAKSQGRKDWAETKDIWDSGGSIKPWCQAPDGVEPTKTVE